MLDIGPEAAEARGNGLAGLRMQPHLARQRQELERAVEIDALGIGALGQRRTLGLLPAILAELDIGPETAAAQRHLEPADRIDADRLPLAAERGRVAAVGKLAGEAAFGIVGAADEGTELADLEAEAPGGAGRAGARIAAGLRAGEDMRPEHVVQGIEHLRDAQFADVLYRGDEIAPEVAKHVLPCELAGRDEVELLLEIGGEIVFDVAG